MPDPEITEGASSFYEETVLDYINIRYKLVDRRAIRGAYAEASQVVSRPSSRKVEGTRTSD